MIGRVVDRSGHLPKQIAVRALPVVVLEVWPEHWTPRRVVVHPLLALGL